MSRTPEYVAHKGINWSLLKLLDKSPAHYRHAADSDDDGDTASRNMLRASHMAVLEPERAAVDIIEYPGRRAGNAWKDFQAEHAGKSILNAREMAIVTGCASAIREHAEANLLLSGGEAEVPMYWTDPETGRECKGIADYLHLDVSNGPVLIDYKGCGSVAPHNFARDVARMGYHGQLAHYAAGVEAITGHRPTCYLVAQETSAPHDVGVYRLTDDTLWLGEQMRRRLLRLLVACEASGVWPGAVPNVVELELPSWVWQRDDPTEQEDE